MRSAKHKDFNKLSSKKLVSNLILQHFNDKNYSYFFYLFKESNINLEPIIKNVNDAISFR